MTEGVVEEGFPLGGGAGSGFAGVGGLPGRGLLGTGGFLAGLPTVDCADEGPSKEGGGGGTSSSSSSGGGGGGGASADIQDIRARYEVPLFFLFKLQRVFFS